MSTDFTILIANEKHFIYAMQICVEMELSAKVRGTGISKRTPEQILQKISDGKAVIAISYAGEWAGFCYIESWGNDQFVSNSGLIVAPKFRKHGLGRSIKRKIFELALEKFPDAKIFGLTTSSAVMKINSEMGYEPVAYSEITEEENFWKGCKSCVNYEILESKGKKNCLCTAMVFNPKSKKKEIKKKLFFRKYA
ncbi:GNAT family N-acetyltransferase [soil metagenome]